MLAFIDMIDALNTIIQIKSNNILDQLLMGNAGCYGCGGIPVGAPIGMAPLATGPIIDADPITPGIQANPGVVTPVGPPRVVGGGPVGFRPNPVGFGGFGAVDADPITPGIQSRPGVVTAVGPSRAVGGGFGGPGVRPGFMPTPSTVRF